MNRAALALTLVVAATPAAPLHADDLPSRPSHVVTARAEALPFLHQLGPAGSARSSAAGVAGVARALAWSAPEASARRRDAVAGAAGAVAASVGLTDGLRARPGAFATQRGSLPSPLPDIPILAGFGVRSRTTSQTVARHTGITFAPAPDLPVLAVADGVCVHSGRIDGFGVVVLLLHQDGYMTVYANLSRAMVELGATVETGTAVGQTGAASSFGDDGLYFELRELGVPIDPADWVQTSTTGSGRGTSR